MGGVLVVKCESLQGSTLQYGGTTRISTRSGTDSRARKKIEEVFGWLKTVAGLRKLKHRGTAQVDWMVTFACAAYNLVRLRRLIPV
jgi:hypothetical protein